MPDAFAGMGSLLTRSSRITTAVRSGQMTEDARVTAQIAKQNFDDALKEARQYELQFDRSSIGMAGGNVRIGKSEAASVSSQNVPVWTGSGPKAGVLGINRSSQSSAALQNFKPAGAVEYVYDPVSSTFLVRGSQQPFKHSILADSIGADPNKVVGGMLTRNADGTFSTNEASGHFYRNWTPEIRQQFQDAMKDYGLPVEHTTGF